MRGIPIGPPIEGVDYLPCLPGHEHDGVSIEALDPTIEGWVCRHCLVRMSRRGDPTTESGHVRPASADDVCELIYS